MARRAARPAGLPPAPEGVTEVVLGGGPCAGKSSALQYLAEHLRERGLTTIVAPEVATEVILMGAVAMDELAAAEPERYEAVEAVMLRAQRDLRLRARQLAEALGTPAVILYDRGECDVASYLSPEAYDRALDSLGLDRFEVRDSYHAVIHLRTTALGAPWAYTLANNAARRESTLEAAIQADEETLQAWVGHPRLSVVDNSTDFAGKLERVLALVETACGLTPSHQRDDELCTTEIPPPTSEGLAALCVESAPTVVAQEELTERDDAAELVRLRRRAQARSSSVMRRRLLRGAPVPYEVAEHATSRDWAALLAARAQTQQLTLDDLTALPPAPPLAHCRLRWAFLRDGAAFVLDASWEAPPSTRLDPEAPVPPSATWRLRGPRSAERAREEIAVLLAQPTSDE